MQSDNLLPFPEPAVKAVPDLTTVLSTGLAELDDALPGGGWPAHGLIELYPRRQGIGELSLLLPALASLSRLRRWIAWVNPPHIPYAPALAMRGLDLSRVLLVHHRPDKAPTEPLWAMEQGLASGACGAVLGWPAHIPDYATLRRLQLAAERGGSRGFLFRSLSDLQHPSPASLRLTLDTTPTGLRVDILKCRSLGGVASAGASLRLGSVHAMAESVLLRTAPCHRLPRGR